MTGLQIHREEEAAGRITLRLEGTLDGRTAQELSSSLQALGQSEVVLDFAHLREFKDSAVGILTHGLKDGAVQLRGLATHQERMFRYFGVLATPTTHRAYYTPEDILSA